VMGLYPAMATQWRGKGLKLLATEPLVRRLADQLSPEAAELSLRWGAAPGPDGPAGEHSAAPGTVLAVAAGVGLVVATGGCPLLLRSSQLEGKGPVEGAGLIQQLGAAVGDRLG
jgi:methionyl-tRNA formyltransferase